MRHALRALAIMACGLAGAEPALAQAVEGPPPAAAAAKGKDCPPGIGCVTRRPLPRFVSLKGAEARARRGPGPDHRVDWIYQRSGLPLKVTAEYENWRRVEDAEGVGGWMHYALLSPTRTAIVVEDMAELRASPDVGSAVLARAETGVVARVIECRPGWCRITRDGLRGWVPKAALWGVDPDETFE
ncbi:MAG: SH3 domain-containing protein [Gemmobacter sp.]|nr:SH3 domain-containing protein [Gemmobacter sp.]